jgi:hypothetical protein
MPLHDWTRVDAGLFHNFHLRWIAALTDTLNEDLLSEDYYALAEQRMPLVEPDVLTLRVASDRAESSEGGIAVSVAPPQTAIVSKVEEDLYARKANRIAVHHRHGEVVAIIEIVSPGNKASNAAFHAFTEKVVNYIRSGVHVLVVDVFPPGPRDPCGIHKAIWDEFREEPFTLPPQKQAIVAAYDAGPPWVAYVQPVGIGDSLPEMPLFLRPEFYVPLPLEPTYATAWRLFPRVLKRLLE